MVSMKGAIQFRMGECVLPDEQAPRRAARKTVATTDCESTGASHLRLSIIFAKSFTSLLRSVHSQVPDPNAFRHSLSDDLNDYFDRLENCYLRRSTGRNLYLYT